MPEDSIEQENLDSEEPEEEAPQEESEHDDWAERKFGGLIMPVDSDPTPVETPESDQPPAHLRGNALRRWQRQQGKRREQS